MSGATAAGARGIVRCPECNGQILGGSCIQCGRTPKPAASRAEIAQEAVEQHRREANLRHAMRRSFSRQESEA